MLSALFFRSRMAACALLPRRDENWASPVEELSTWIYRELLSGGQRQKIAGPYGIDTNDFHILRRQDQQPR
jgi:hypothetical protein